MSEQTLFTGFWEHESKTTRNVLARIPEASDYRPDPKSRTAQRDRLADRLRGEDDHRRARERQGGVGPAAGAGDHEGDGRRLRRAERGDGRAAGRRCPQGAGTARSSSSARQRPAAPMAWSFLFDIVHHRGQITTYLRPMGSTVPQIYGPSARRAVAVAPRGLTRSATDCYYWRFEYPPEWACGAAGSAPEWHSGGHRFDPGQVHQPSLTRAYAEA